jgi:hypothetical protein
VIIGPFALSVAISRLSVFFGDLLREPMVRPVLGLVASLHVLVQGSGYHGLELWGSEICTGTPTSAAHSWKDGVAYDLVMLSATIEPDPKEKETGKGRKQPSILAKRICRPPMW